LPSSTPPPPTVDAALRRCPICDAPPSEILHRFASKLWAVVRCQGCAMVYLKNAPRQDTLKDEHAWEHTAGTERAKRRDGRRAYYAVSDRLKKVKRLIRRGREKNTQLINQLRPDGGRLLDVGCAYGRTLESLNTPKWVLHGIEPSPALAKQANTLCQQRGGHVVADTAVGGLPQFEADFFDVVVMRSFLEHEVNVGPVLRGVLRALKPGGLTVIKVPNAGCWNAALRGANWPGVRHPDHVNYFRPQDLRQAVRQAGFDRITFPLLRRLPSSDNMWLVAHKAQAA